MKIEISKEFPQYFKPSYPGEFELFSHLETTAAIPSVLFAITTWKENRKPNVCFHAWSCFHGDKTAFFAVMGNLYQHTHTYANIQREKCFCINFLPISYYDKLIDTINHNDYEADEFSVGNFSLVNAKTIHAPMIQEAFVNMECVLKETQDLSGAGLTSMIIGQVQHIFVEEEYAQGYEKRYGKDGFMMLIPAPQDLKTGEPHQSAIATINIEKYD
jgi:flavin reductase (DIM6/NTAB) family NADH-FMN oxidoreductase RutF